MGELLLKKRHYTMDFDRAAALLSAMANSKRLEIFQLLVTKEIAVNELGRLVNLSQSAVSQHLSKLRAAGLVDTRRHSRIIYYSCNSDEVKAVLRLVIGQETDNPSSGTE